MLPEARYSGYCNEEFQNIFQNNGTWWVARIYCWWYSKCFRALVFIEPYYSSQLLWKFTEGVLFGKHLCWPSIFSSNPPLILWFPLVNFSLSWFFHPYFFCCLCFVIILPFLGLIGLLLNIWISSIFILTGVNWLLYYFWSYFLCLI